MFSVDHYCIKKKNVALYFKSKFTASASKRSVKLLSVVNVSSVVDLSLQVEWLSFYIYIHSHINSLTLFYFHLMSFNSFYAALFTFCFLVLFVHLKFYLMYVCVYIRDVTI